MNCSRLIRAFVTVGADGFDYSLYLEFKPESHNIRCHKIIGYSALLSNHKWTSPESSCLISTRFPTISNKLNRLGMKASLKNPHNWLYAELKVHWSFCFSLICNYSVLMYILNSGSLFTCASTLSSCQTVYHCGSGSTSSRIRSSSLTCRPQTTWTPCCPSLPRPSWIPAPSLTTNWDGWANRSEALPILYSSIIL